MATPDTTTDPKTATSLPYFNLDDIDLEERIGRGNFSVFKATMKGQTMAVKKMDCDKNKIPREVTVQSNLPPHPNVLPLLGITHSKDGFSIYVCMELGKTSLYHHLHKDKKTPSLQQSIKWAIQIARGMHHIHQHGVAHRDLKSANVLLFDKEDTARICDFGSARPLEHTATMTGMTGTYRWMAPEFNDKATTKINQRCDVFSYAMVLFEVFAHVLPFPDLDEGVVLSRVRDGERPSIPPDLPSYIQQLMRSCWEHKANDRPTFEKILQTLDIEEQLFSAAESGDVKTVQRLIEDHVDVNSRNVDDKTALHLASQRGHLGVVQLLIGAEAQLNLQDKVGITALSYACELGQVEMVKVLLQMRADIGICNKDGLSPLYVACQEGYTEIVDLLLFNGANPNLAGMTHPCSVPLEIAAKKGHVKVVERLLRERVNINYQNKDGISPLYTASAQGHNEVVDALLKNGANPNLACTAHPCSVPLGVAAERGHVKVVERLLGEQVNVNCQNKFGSTALYYACKEGHSEIVQCLLQKRADISIRNKSGRTAMDIARRRGHSEILGLLQQHM